MSERRLEHPKAKQILSAAVVIATQRGLTALTRDTLASSAQVPNGSINYYYTTIDRLRTLVIKHAIEHRILRIVGEAVVARHPVARRANKALRTEAVASLAK